MFITAIVLGRDTTVKSSRIAPSGNLCVEWVRELVRCVRLSQTKHDECNNAYERLQQSSAYQFSLVLVLVSKFRVQNELLVDL